jgi:hypothetical protein
MVVEKKPLSDEGFQTIFEFFKRAAVGDPETFDKQKCYYYIGLLLNHADILVKQCNAKGANK